MPRLRNSPECRSTVKSPKRMISCDELSGDTATCLGSPQCFSVLSAYSLRRVLSNQALKGLRKRQEKNTRQRLTMPFKCDLLHRRCPFSGRAPKIESIVRMRGCHDAKESRVAILIARHRYAAVSRSSCNEVTTNSL